MVSIFPAFRVRFGWVLASAILLLTACGGGSSGSGDTTAPTVVSVLPSDHTIGPDTIISVVFSETMARGSLRVGGDLAPEAETGIWFDGFVTDDATTVRPLTAWSGGTGRTLTFDATDLAGNPVPTVTLTFDVDATPPVGTVVEPFDGILTTTQPIVIQFDEPMSDIVNPGDTIGDASTGGTFLLVSGNRLQLKLEPTTAWPLGRDQTLRVDVADEHGNGTTLEFPFDVVDGIVHVSPAGDDGNSGEANQPLKTISAAVNMAINTVLTGSVKTAAAIRVAEGLYTVNSGTSGPVVLGENMGEGGISIYGGYDTNFTSRDPATLVSTLQDTSTTIIGAPPSSIDDPNRALHAGTWSDERSVIDGMTIRGSDQGDYSAAIYVKGGLLELRDCIIEGGGSNGGNHPSVRSYGVLDNGGNGLTLRNDTVYGGVAPDTAAAYLSVSARALFEGNRIDGGGENLSGSHSTGIFMFYTDDNVVRNNVIDGGRGAVYSAGMLIYDLSTSNTDPVVQNNTINASSSNQSRGIWLASNSAKATIENNIVSAAAGSTQICIDEYYATADPVSVRNNVLFDCPTALYRDEASLNLTNIDDVNNLMDTVASGNLSTDPMFVDRDGADNDLTTFADNDWHLSGASPASVTEGGLDLSADFDVDLDGIARSVPWSIGAYEQN